MFIGLATALNAAKTTKASSVVAFGLGIVGLAVRLLIGN